MRAEGVSVIGARPRPYLFGPSEHEEEGVAVAAAEDRVTGLRARIANAEGGQILHAGTHNTAQRKGQVAADVETATGLRAGSTETHKAVKWNAEIGGQREEPQIDAGEQA
jgi:hypothetical protein